MLHLVESALEDTEHAGYAVQKERLLDTGNSVYKVRSDDRGLQPRHVWRAASGPRCGRRLSYISAGEHLTNARDEAYGRHPDPEKLYSEAVKAIEADAIPVVIPEDGGSTLGKVMGELRAISISGSS